MSKTIFKVSLSPGSGVTVEFELGDEPVDLEDLAVEACGVMKRVSDAWDSWADENADEHGRRMKQMMREQQEHQLDMWDKQKSLTERTARLLDEEGM